jgi:hypothetical protein
MRLIFLGIFLVSCSSTPKPENTTVILKTTWAWCYNKCGRKDNLAAVSNAACVCSNGAIVPLQPTVPESQENKSGVFDKLSSFLESIGN